MTKRKRSLKSYELTDHLGNVLTTISDRKKRLAGTTPAFEAVIETAQDYYPFGSLMPGRKYNAGEYRFGFNGQEKDDEITGVTGSHTTALFWEYDTRLGRRWNIDPVDKPWESSYAAFANNPIWLKDLLGSDTTFNGDKQAQNDYNSTYKQINDVYNGIIQDISDYKSIAREKGKSEDWLKDKLEPLYKEKIEWGKLKMSFDAVISSEEYCFEYSTDVSGFKPETGGKTSQSRQNESNVLIRFRPGFLNSVVHETRHGWGIILGEWSEWGGYDYRDEYEAYSYQKVFDNESVVRFIESAQSKLYPENVDLKRAIIFYYENKVKIKDESFKQHRAP